MIDVALAAAARLQTHAADVFRVVGTVADFEALAGMPRSVPAAYVLPLSEHASRNGQVTPGTMQLHRCTIGVLLFAHHAGDASGAKSVTALHDLRQAVQAALVGWCADAASKPTVFAGGELVDATAGTSLWRDDFEVERVVIRPQSAAA